MTTPEEDLYYIPDEHLPMYMVRTQVFNKDRSITDSCWSISKEKLDWLFNMLGEPAVSMVIDLTAAEEAARALASTTVFLDNFDE